jgi:hypothetical protein
MLLYRHTRRMPSRSHARRSAQRRRSRTARKPGHDVKLPFPPTSLSPHGCYASANYRSEWATYQAVCGKRTTLLRSECTGPFSSPPPMSHRETAARLRALGSIPSWVSSCWTSAARREGTDAARVSYWALRHCPIAESNRCLSTGIQPLRVTRGSGGKIALSSGREHAPNPSRWPDGTNV